MRPEPINFGRSVGPALSRPVRLLVEATSRESGLPVRELMGPGRGEHVARWRQVAMFAVRERHGLPLAQIARAFQRDHTTVLHGISTIEARMTPELRAAVDRIIAAADLAAVGPAARSPLAEAQAAVTAARSAVAEALAALDAAGRALAVAEDGLSAARGAVGGADQRGEAA